MKKSVLALIIIVIILAVVAAFYYTNLTSATSFNNSEISFQYPGSFALTESPIGAENSTGHFVCALTPPSGNSAIVIYRIPMETTSNVTSNEIQNSTPANNTTNSQSNNTTNNTTPVINRTIVVTVDNLQAYLDGVIARGGTTQEGTRNNYTHYVSAGLRTAIVSYNSTSRTGNVTIISINETAIVKDGYGYFYVIELLNGDNSQEASDAYNQIVNSFRIMAS